MNRNILIIVIIILCFNFVYANNLENETFQGTSMQEKEISSNVNPFSESAKDLQIKSAENNENQIGIKTVTIQEKKRQLLQRVSKLWGMIGGLFIIIFDILKGALYIIEIYFMLYIIFKLFPNILIKIKNSVSNWYMGNLR